MDTIGNNNVFQDGNNQEDVMLKSPEVLLPQYAPKPLFELTKGDNVFAVCILVLSIFISIFGVFGGFSLGYFISMAAFILSFTVYFIKSNKIRVYPLICMTLALGNSVIFITTTNISVKFFGVIVSFVLSLFGAYGLALGNTVGNRATIGIVFSALSTMGNIGISVKSLLSNSDGKKKSVGKVMLGLLCAVPVLIVIVPLLLKSDDAFKGMMSSIFNNSGNGFNVVLKAVFGVFISLFIISYGFSLKANRVSAIKETKLISVDNVCIISFLSAIAACYLLYLFSQLAYFFSAFKGFLPNQEITYSQYARKGFFEMCIIAVINLALVFLGLLFAKKQAGKVCVGIRVILTFIAGFTLIIIATAISKMVLYINEYGMTVLRVTTSSFMLFLAVTFIAVILRIYKNNINIIKTTVVAAGIIVLLLGVLNVNEICAKYNYDAYKSGQLKSIDVKALYDLGDEGIPYLAKLAGDDDKNVAYNAQHYLSKAYMEDYFDYMYFSEIIDGFDAKIIKSHQKYKGFSYFNIPRNRAYNVLYAFLEKNPQFDQKCIKYYNNYCAEY